VSYPLLKTIHVLSMSLFFGAGLASAIVKLRADRTKDPRVIAFVLGHIVWADWLFTIPSGVLLPITGLWMVVLAGLPFTRPWIVLGIGFYAVAGLTWLPAAVLQLRMRRAADQALSTGQPLPPEYWRWTRAWIGLGIPSFGAALFTVYVMVTKHVPLWQN